MPQLLMPEFVTRSSARRRPDTARELIVDNFAGGGGVSMGIEWATGRPPDIAVNHDPFAVKMHHVNHPGCRHLLEDVWDVDPIEVTRGQSVGLAWFSPDCTYFSSARGGKPIRPKGRKIRALAWVVIRWAKLKRPRVIILENVKEFQHWSPLNEDNMPCPRRKGKTFRHWCSRLRNLGYELECKVLDTAD